ncbi:MAG: TRAP transporter large permease [Deltaproteobacteria bacterium]|nr:TRAP transporter large permease [Deltaproteobacteria bacterium]
MTLTILVLGLIAGLILGLPVFISLGIATYLALLASDIPMTMIAQTLYQGVDKFPLLAIPCFILAGSLMEYGGVTRQIIDVVSRFTGKITGGLGITTILACMFFSAISGSGPGTVAAVGSLMIPAMIRHGYDRGYAGAVSSSGGTLGILIPPSNPMIIYGVIANVSITGMFLAGMIPGAIIGLAHCFVAYYVAKRMGFRGTGESFEWMDFIKTCWNSKWALAAPVVILGGIYTGIFTPVEASVVAVFYGFFVGGVINRGLNFSKILQALYDSSLITGTVIIIVGTSTLFGQMLTMYQAPLKLTNFITKVSTNWFVVLLLLILVFYFLGMFMETLSTIIILTPVLLPLVTQLGIDPIHFGIIFVVTNEVAFLTPPLGVNLFVAMKMADVSLERLSLHVLPHILAISICILLLAYFPKISIWLPRLLGFGRI